MTKTNKKSGGEVITMSRAAAEALRVIEAGFAVVPVRPRSKAAHDGWETNPGVAPEDVSRVLHGQNYGFKTMDGATDFDLDCPEAIALAAKFLPPTGAVFGRASKRASHYVYWSDLYQTEDRAVIKVEDVDGKVLLELRMGGGGKAAQVVGPGSVNPSGEVVEWEPGCGPELAARVEGNEAKRCLRELGAACLLARHWPDGGRHDVTLPLAGWLARLDWDEGKAVAFIEAVAEAAGDEEVRDRLSAVQSTFRKAKADKKTTGLPTLTTLLGKELANKVAEQLAPESQVARDRLEQMNEEFCVVKDGGKTRVLAFEPQDHPSDHERKVATFYSFPEFANFYCNELVVVGDKPRPLGQAWLRYPKRRTYDGLTFRPDLEPGGTVNGRLNLWQGWGVEPAPGDWSRMRAHVEEVLTAGDEQAARYILNWVAWTPQHSAECAEAALVLMGGRGTGKGTLGNAMCRIFGQHATHISSAAHLAGRFNSHFFAARLFCRRTPRF